MNPTDTRSASLLSSISAMSARTEASGKAIAQGAAARLDAVNNRLEELRPTVLLSTDAADEYQGLIIERHRLNQVVMAP